LNKNTYSFWEIMAAKVETMETQRHIPGGVQKPSTSTLRLSVSMPVTQKPMVLLSNKNSPHVSPFLKEEQLKMDAKQAQQR
jgi:hypothetical protein